MGCYAITNVEAQRELVEQAFRLAASAKFHVRMRGLPAAWWTHDPDISQGVRFEAGRAVAASRVRDMMP